MSRTWTLADEDLGDIVVEQWYDREAKVWVVETLDSPGGYPINEPYIDGTREASDASFRLAQADAWTENYRRAEEAIKAFGDRWDDYGGNPALYSE